MSNKLKTIPLCRLKPSKTNVRKTNRNADIEQLAASIQANGLLENLVVKPSENGDGESYEVVAGGRRLAALKLLAKRRKLDRDQRIPCLIVDAGAAVEASLAENFERLPLHPADQCDAFLALQRAGKAPEDIASRFGITTRFVEQRLKLASVSPKLVADFRAGTMSLEQLTAFTLSSDWAVQERVWSERSHDQVPASVIRRRLTVALVDASDARARFVGAAAYEAAGGSIVRDLFDAEDGGYFQDSVLLDRLVSEKLSAVAGPVLAEGWHWVEVHADLSHLELHRFGRAGRIEIALGEDDEAYLSSLGARYDELVSELGEGEESPELEKVALEIEALEERKEGWDIEDMHLAGAVVTLGADGEPEIVRGLIKPDAANNPQPAKPRQKKEANAYSEPVLLDLSAHRTAALQEVLARDPETALTALLQALLGQIFYDGIGASCLQVAVSSPDLDRASPSVAGSRAGLALKARHAAWTERLPPSAQCWEWLTGLDGPERLSLLAYCISTSVNALDGRLARAPEAADALGHATGLDMRVWWRPTEAEFFSRLTKTEILAAVTEGASQQAARRLADHKKDRMAKEAERLLVDSGWLPPSLKGTEPEALEQSAAE